MRLDPFELVFGAALLAGVLVALVPFALAIAAKCHGLSLAYALILIVLVNIDANFNWPNLKYPNPLMEVYAAFPLFNSFAFGLAAVFAFKRMLNNA